jgi:putative addiction module killer protein
MYPVVYRGRMLILLRSDAFDQWLNRLKDTAGKAIILDRLERIRETGNFGDHKSVGDEVSELRFKFGPGYRVYYLRDGETVVVLLAGGNKSSQDRDIKQAKKIAEQWRSQ